MGARQVLELYYKHLTGDGIGNGNSARDGNGDAVAGNEW